MKTSTYFVVVSVTVRTEEQSEINKELVNSHTVVKHLTKMENTYEADLCMI